MKTKLAGGRGRRCYCGVPFGLCQRHRRHQPRNQVVTNPPAPIARSCAKQRDRARRSDAGRRDHQEDQIRHHPDMHQAGLSGGELSQPFRCCWARPFGNIVLGGGIGWAIDSASGADNKYDGVVNVTLVPASAEIAAAAPCLRLSPVTPWCRRRCGSLRRPAFSMHARSASAGKNSAGERLHGRAKV